MKNLQDKLKYQDMNRIHANIIDEIHTILSHNVVIWKKHRGFIYDTVIIEDSDEEKQSEEDETKGDDEGRVIWANKSNYLNVILSHFGENFSIILIGAVEWRKTKENQEQVKVELCRLKIN